MKCSRATPTQPAGVDYRGELNRGTFPDEARLQGRAGDAIIIRACRRASGSWCSKPRGRASLRAKWRYHERTSTGSTRRSRAQGSRHVDRVHDQIDCCGAYACVVAHVRVQRARTGSAQLERTPDSTPKPRRHSLMLVRTLANDDRTQRSFSAALMALGAAHVAFLAPPPPPQAATAALLPSARPGVGNNASVPTRMLLRAPHELSGVGSVHRESISTWANEHPQIWCLYRAVALPICVFHSACQSRTNAKCVCVGVASAHRNCASVRIRDVPQGGLARALDVQSAACSRSSADGQVLRQFRWCLLELR